MKKININYVVVMAFVYVALVAVFALGRWLSLLDGTENSVLEAYPARDIANLFKYGFLYDTRIISMSLCGLLLFFCLTRFLNKFHINFTPINAYIFLFSFISTFFSVVNFYYYNMYKSKIDIFIFGLKDDNTSQILKIIWNDYPIFWLLLLIFSVSFAITFSAKKILKTKILLNLPLAAGLNIALIIALFIGIRGSVTSFPLREAEHRISKFEIINHLNPNPILALSWATKHYKNEQKFSPVNRAEFEKLQDALFPLFYTASKAPKPKPHIVVNLIESFGTNMLSVFEGEFGDGFHTENGGGIHNKTSDGIHAKNTQNAPKNDILRRLRAHFTAADIFNPHKKDRQDFIFYRFTSSTLGTAGSTAQLYFQSPITNITFGKFKETKLPFSPLAVFADNGYEVVFVTSSHGSWQNYHDYFTAQGASRVYDAAFLLDKFAAEHPSANGFGVRDEFMYRQILEVLESATKPTLVVTLTTSNHPPFDIPSEFVESFGDAPIEKFNKNDAHYAKQVLGAFAYSSDCFGAFLDALKASKMAQNTIVFATGDHKNRDIRQLANPMLDYGVPLYAFVPMAVQKSLGAFVYDAHRVGSHKDIFATLFELVLDGAPYISMGGRNLFGADDDKRRRFGANSAIMLDTNGLYLGDAFYRWSKHNNAKNLNELLSVESATDTAMDSGKIPNFHAKFNELDNMQINYRLMGFAEQ